MKSSFQKHDQLLHLGIYCGILQTDDDIGFSTVLLPALYDIHQSTFVDTFTDLLQTQTDTVAELQLGRAQPSRVGVQEFNSWSIQNNGVQNWYLAHFLAWQSALIEHG